jgi:3-oxoadipate enol-lactonase
MPHFHTGEVLLHYELIDRAHRPVESSAAAAAQLGAPPEPPVLVLLNGLFQRSEGWDGLLPYLPPWPVLRYDMRGQGRSSAPEGPYPPAAHAADLGALLTHLGVRRHCWIGLSNGGVVALEAARRAPAGLCALVLCCTAAHLDGAARAAIASWGQAVRAGGVLLRLQVSLPWGHGTSFLGAHPELLHGEVLAAAAAQAPTAEAHLALVDGLLAATDLRPALPAIRTPTLVLSGDEDLLFPPRHGAVIAAGLPRAQRQVLTGVGHSAHLEAPERLGAAIATFLRGLELDVGGRSAAASLPGR